MKPQNIVSPKGIAVFPRLNKPDTKFVAEGEFSVKLKMDINDPKVAEFIELIEQARQDSLPWAKADLAEKLAGTKDAAKKGGLKKKLETVDLADSPVKPVLDEDGNETNFVEVRFKCKAEFKGKDGETVKTRPALRDSLKQEINPADVIVGGGSVIKVAAAMYPYYNPKDNVSGVTFRLRAVQVINLSQGGGGDFGFGEEEDGDEIAPSASKAASDDATESDGDF
jgi:hypothetical protein